MYSGVSLQWCWWQIFSTWGTVCWPSHPVKILLWDSCECFTPLCIICSLMQRLIMAELWSLLTPACQFIESLPGWEEVPWMLEYLSNIRWVMHIRCMGQAHTHTSAAIWTPHSPDNQSLWLHYSLLGRRGVSHCLSSLTALCLRASEWVNRWWRNDGTAGVCGWGC